MKLIIIVLLAIITLTLGFLAIYKQDSFVEKTDNRDYDKCSQQCIIEANQKMRNLDIQDLLKETENMQTFTNCMVLDQSTSCKIMSQQGDNVTRTQVKKCIGGCGDEVPNSSIIGQQAKCIVKCADKYLPPEF